MATVRTSLLQVLGCGALLLMAGCQTLGSCKNPLTDATAQNLGPLKMPVGLDGPDTRQAVAIPPLAEPEAPRTPGDPCLDEPPAWTPPATPSVTMPGPQAAPVATPKQRPRPSGPPR